MKQDTWPVDARFEDRPRRIARCEVDAHLAANGITLRSLPCLVANQAIPEGDAVTGKGLSFDVEAVPQDMPGPSRAATSNLGAGNRPRSVGPAFGSCGNAQVVNRALAKSNAGGEKRAEKQDKQYLFFPTRDDVHLFRTLRPAWRPGPPGAKP